MTTARNGNTSETTYYWGIAADFLRLNDVDRGTLMGFPCLRVNGDFFSTCQHRSGDLIVKLPKSRVAGLIEAGRGEAFTPAGRIFREWVLVKKRNRKAWIALMEESLAFVSQAKQ